jgi:16S rRNA G527 N7-methylase RsmG
MGRGHVNVTIPFDNAALLTRHLPSGRLDAYYEFLMQENQKVNLVSRETTRADFDRMVAECLLPLDQFEPKRRFSTLLDIGSGGGLPLIPFMLTGRIDSAVAVERTTKKARALDRLCRQLALPVKVNDRTIEEVRTKSRFDLITLRYVKLTNELAATIAPLLAPGARLVYYSAVSLSLKQFEISSCNFVTAPDQPAKSFSIISLKA